MFTSTYMYIDNGIMYEPRLHFYLMDSVLPKVDYAYREGRWQSEASWPSPAIEMHRWFLHPGTLSATQNPEHQGGTLALRLMAMAVNRQSTGTKRKLRAGTPMPRWARYSAVPVARR